VTKKPILFRRIAAVGLTFLAVAHIERARAEYPDGDVAKFTLGAGVAYDDNVFRLPPNVNPAPASGSTARGDTIFTLNAGVALNKDISRQNFVLGANVVRGLYTQHTAYDYTLFDFGAIWNWQVGNKLGGKIGYTQNQFPNSSLDVRSFTQNIRTIGIAEASVGYQFLPAWEARAAYRFVDITNGSAVFRLSDSQQNVYEGAIRYRTRFGNLVDLYYRYTDGTSPNLPDPLPLDLSTKGFTQKDFGINVAQWEFSGRSRFSGFLAYTQRSYPHFAQRDFSGPTWNLTYIYLPTTSTRINLSFYRLIGIYTDVTTNYIQTTGVTLNPTWQATGKLGFGLIASYQDREYKGDPGILTTVAIGEKREDKLTIVGINATYAILRTVKGTLYYTWQKRDSNLQRFDFTDNTVGAGVEWTF
jgi:exopolysaccharide biosynthesis operon protein EpsL